MSFNEQKVNAIFYLQESLVHNNKPMFEVSLKNILQVKTKLMKITSSTTLIIDIIVFFLKKIYGYLLFLIMNILLITNKYVVLITYKLMV